MDIDFDDVYRWLGYDRKDNAVRLLKREIPDGQYVLLTNEEGTGPANRASYMISFNQFEELMIAAQTAQGKKARKFVLLLKRILQEYLIAEQEAHVQQVVEVARAHEAARANALQIQLDGLRAQQQHLYCFKLFGDRYKCGIGMDVDRRIRQHRTTCPSGHLVCSVPITCKAMEKLFESVMKEHGAWIRMEEYELTGDESEIKSIFGVFARTEELLNTTPLDQYGTLLNLLETALGTPDITRPVTPAALPPIASSTIAAPSDATQQASNTLSAARRASRDAVDNTNPLKDWFEEYVQQTEDPADEYTPNAFHEAFLATGDDRGMTLRTFGSWMRFFNIKRRILDGYNMYTHVKVRTRQEANLANAIEAMEVSAE